MRYLRGRFDLCDTLAVAERGRKAYNQIRVSFLFEFIATLPRNNVVDSVDGWSDVASFYLYSNIDWCRSSPGVRGALSHPGVSQREQTTQSSCSHQRTGFSQFDSIAWWQIDID